jgi:hypothetical protein
VEFQALGNTTKSLNGEDGQRVIGSFGIGFLHQEPHMLTVGMVILGLATFAVLVGFVTLCDRV